MAMTMKKILLFSAALLLVLAAGCAKQTGGEPAAPQSTTLEAVSGDEAEITMILDLNPSSPAAAEQTDGAAKAGETRTTPSATGSDAAKETTLPAAADEGTTAKPAVTTANSGSATTAPDRSGQTTSSGGSTTAPAETTSLPAVRNEPRPATTAASGGNGSHELPAIPLK